MKIAGYTAEQIGYHSYLLVDAGMSKGFDVATNGDALPNWQILHMTSTGHDFADAAHSDSIWNMAKSVALEKAGGVTIEVMKQLLVGLAKNALQLIDGHAKGGRFKLFLANESQIDCFEKASLVEVRMG